MNLELTNRWLTLAANIGVLAGIIFLGFELQQNTVATRLAAASNFNSSFSELELFISGNPEFAELLEKGRNGKDVSDVEKLRLMTFYNNVLRQWQFTHFLYLSDALNEDNWQAHRAFMSSIINEDFGLLKHWQTYRSQYSSAFNDMLAHTIEERPRE